MELQSVVAGGKRSPTRAIEMKPPSPALRLSFPEDATRGVLLAVVVPSVEQLQTRVHPPTGPDRVDFCCARRESGGREYRIHFLGQPFGEDDGVKLGRTPRRSRWDRCGARRDRSRCRQWRTCGSLCPRHAHSKDTCCGQLPLDAQLPVVATYGQPSISLDEVYPCLSALAQSPGEGSPRLLLAISISDRFALRPVQHPRVARERVDGGRPLRKLGGNVNWLACSGDPRCEEDLADGWSQRRR